MAKAGIRLPEKDYFSPKEIAERWGCLVADVFHYMDKGLLRPAIRTANVLGLFNFLPKSSDFYPTPSFLYLSAAAIETKPIEPSLAKAIFDGSINSTPGSWLKTTTLFYTSELETLEGEKFKVLSTPDQGKLFSLNGLVEEEKAAYGGQPWKWNTNAVIITGEERDRFEREHGIDASSLKAPSETLYSTTYIEIMMLAIREFFEPRRPLDAKKMEVTEWIKERLAEKGLSRSSNIADAMFTIIKPPDHDPRNRRG